MSSISGTSTISVAQSGSSGGAHRGHGKRLEDDLSSYLSQQGVSADDQKEIQSEIKDGISSSSNGGRPDFSKLKDVVKQVLDKHGLSGDDFVSQMPTAPSHGGGRAGGAGHAGGPPPGPPPSDAQAADATASADDTKDSLLQKLVAAISQNTASSSQSSNASSLKTTLDSLDVNA